MYFCILSCRKVSVGDVLVLKKDNGGTYYCSTMDGCLVGFLGDRQPDGCLSYLELAAAADERKILCSVEIIINNLIFLKANSLGFFRCERTEIEGYPITRIVHSV